MQRVAAILLIFGPAWSIEDCFGHAVGFRAVFLGDALLMSSRAQI
jgi:hypothetical protein